MAYRKVSDKSVARSKTYAPARRPAWVESEPTSPKCGGGAHSRPQFQIVIRRMSFAAKRGELSLVFPVDWVPGGWQRAALIIDDPIRVREWLPQRNAWLISTT